ncbi:P-loop containing nucleoside triphosphate hydrolase protein [Cytidiella melzeri]|nr:P-loop containing nucleoside triphosphate hydrolase protein [Cytidiella melzeri]
MRDAEWTKNILGTVIDEAHCVLEWKESFRTSFGLFHKAWVYLPGKPIFAASATLTPSMIDSLADTLSFACSNSFILNVGNNRSNLTTVVCRMVGGEKDFAALDFLVDEVAEGKPLVRTMVFLNSRDTARRACNYVKSKLPEDSPYQEQIFAMWATKSARAKRKIMKQFRTGKIIILFATEVAGMGIDLGDIQRIVQYLIPQKLTQFTQ